MLRYAVFSIFAVLLSSGSSLADSPPIEFIGEIDAGAPRAVAVDEEGRIYTAQPDGTIWVQSLEGEKLAVISNRDREGNTILRYPSDLAVDGGKLFVVDEILNRVVIISQEGEHIESFGNWGQGPKEFFEPMGIAVNDGLIYVADTRNNRVQVFGPNGVFLGILDAQGTLTKPVDVAVDYRSHVYALSRTRMIVFKPTGKISRSDDTSIDPKAIATGSVGYYVTDFPLNPVMMLPYGRGRRFGFGLEGSNAGELGSVTGIAVDRENRIYVSDLVRGKVLIFRHRVDSPPRAQDPPPTSVHWLRDIRMSPGELACNEKEGLLIAIDRHMKTVLFIRDGAVVQTTSFPDWDPVAVDVGPEGYLWVLDGSRESLLKITRWGEVLFAVGAEGSSPGLFSRPTDVAVSPQGLVYVADRGNGRVQIFDSKGNFLNLLGKGGTSELIKRPRSVAIDRDGIVYVLDDKKRTVTLYSPDGLPLKEYNERMRNVDFNDPVSLSVTPNELFVLDAGAKEIKVFSRNGIYDRSFGTGGTGKGDFRSPVSVIACGDSFIAVADAGNSRIQEFSLTYTPVPPREPYAVGLTRKVVVKWKESPGTYIEGYRVYRARGDRGGKFREIATVSETTFTDSDVEAGTIYRYRITALAREGRESPMSAVASDVPY
jgi:DNA-binding beta-propeller fold protein YncE